MFTNWINKIYSSVYLIISTGQLSAASFILASFPENFAPGITDASPSTLKTSGQISSHKPHDVQPSSIQTFFMAMIIVFICVCARPMTRNWIIELNSHHQFQEQFQLQMSYRRMREK